MSATDIDRIWGMADQHSDQLRKAHRAREVWTAIVAGELRPLLNDLVYAMGGYMAAPASESKSGAEVTA